MNGFFTTLKKWFGPYDPEPEHVPEITPEQVADIERLYATGKFTQRELGAMFGVHQSQVSRILSGESHGGALK